MLLDNLRAAAACLRRADGRIPLKDLIRFKERQWFVEELEVRREWTAGEGGGRRSTVHALSCSTHGVASSVHMCNCHAAAHGRGVGVMPLPCLEVQ